MTAGINIQLSADWIIGEEGMWDALTLTLHRIRSSQYKGTFCPGLVAEFTLISRSGWPADKPAGGGSAGEDAVATAAAAAPRPRHRPVRPPAGPGATTRRRPRHW